MRFVVVMILASAIGCSSVPEVAPLAKVEKQVIAKKEDGRSTVVSLGNGTGFFVGERGVLVTAAHVVAGNSKLFIYLSDRPLFARRAYVIAADYDADIAVLRVYGVKSETVHFCTTGKAGQSLSAYAWRRDQTERTVGQFVGPLYSGRWLAEIMIGPGFSGGPIYDSANNCVMGIAIMSSMDARNPRAIFTRPEASDTIMRVLRRWAPKSIKGL